jgi:hypothetical protein
MGFRLHGRTADRQQVLLNRLHFRHKRVGVCAMRRNYAEPSGWGLWIAIAVAGLIVAGAIALAVYGGRVAPQQHPIEQIVPNDHLPA